MNRPRGQTYVSSRFRAVQKTRPIGFYTINIREVVWPLSKLSQLLADARIAPKIKTALGD